MFEIDPVIVLAARYAVGLLFAISCWSKLRQFNIFKATLADYELVPAPLLLSASLVVVAAEALIAGLALLNQFPVFAMLMAGGLLALYAAGIGVNLLRGRRDIDCGCTGPAVKQLLSGWLLVRNAALIGLALLGTQASLARPLTIVDYGLIAIVLAVGCLLYAALNQLMANTPRLDALDALMDAN